MSNKLHVDKDGKILPIEPHVHNFYIVQGVVDSLNKICQRIAHSDRCPRKLYRTLQDTYSQAKELRDMLESQRRMHGC